MYFALRCFALLKPKMVLYAYTKGDPPIMAEVKNPDPDYMNKISVTVKEAYEMISRTPWRSLGEKAEVMDYVIDTLLTGFADKDTDTE